MSGRPSQCFLFQSCGRRVENATFDCLLNRENTLGVEPFVASEEECQVLCQKVSNVLRRILKPWTFTLFADYSAKLHFFFGSTALEHRLSKLSTNQNAKYGQATFHYYWKVWKADGSPVLTKNSHNLHISVNGQGFWLQCSHISI